MGRDGERWREMARTGAHLPSVAVDAVAEGAELRGAPRVDDSALGDKQRGVNKEVSTNVWEESRKCLDLGDKQRGVNKEVSRKSLDLGDKQRGVNKEVSTNV